MTKKGGQIFEEKNRVTKIGYTHQMSPRVTPTLVTPLFQSTADHWQRGPPQCGNKKLSYRKECAQLTSLYRTVQDIFICANCLGVDHECDRRDCLLI